MYTHSEIFVIFLVLPTRRRVYVYNLGLYEAQYHMGIRSDVEGALNRHIACIGALPASKGI